MILPEANVYTYDNNSIDETDEIARKAGAIVKDEYKSFIFFIYVTNCNPYACMWNYFRNCRKKT